VTMFLFAIESVIFTVHRKFEAIGPAASAVLAFLAAAKTPSPQHVLVCFPIPLVLLVFKPSRKRRMTWWQCGWRQVKLW
jgi:hypothetical protein